MTAESRAAEHTAADHWIALDGAASRDEIAGHPVARTYGDVAAEYAALRERAAVIDRSARQRMTFTGAKAAELLTGMVTNDLLALAPGQGAYAAALTAKGRIVADPRVYALAADRLLVDAPPRAAAGWTELVRKFVNPRLAKYVDVTQRTRQLAIHGPDARDVAADVTGVDAAVLEALEPYAHRVAEPDETGTAALGARLVVVRVPDLGGEGYELLGEPASVAAAWARAVDAGAEPCGLDAYAIARVEAGRPEWGIDIDDATIPQEANLDELHAISYTKGCYTGQEVVARIHFRGHVNRHLRGLASLTGDELPQGAELVDEAGKAVGHVRSSVRSPRLGPIALGMVRREVAAGAELTVRHDEWTGRARVAVLPFPPAAPADAADA